MRILIGYDGSEWADVALEELSAAGLGAEADVMVVSVPDSPVELPASCYTPLEAHALPEVSLTLHHAHALAAHALHEAVGLASKAAAQLQERFPKWRIVCDSTPGIPQDVLVRKAREWEADLIIVGSHGRSALVRLFTGSVAMGVVRHAPCSVRISRRCEGSGPTPERIVIGIDSSPDSALAVSAVESRHWSRCEARVVMAIGSFASSVMFTPSVNSPHDLYHSAQRLVKQAAVQLRDAGIVSDPIVRQGDPRHILLEEAKHFKAGCIFVGSRGLKRLESCLLGSVSSSIVSHAPCSVEVVRNATL